MELFGMVAIQLAQDLNHVGVSIGTTEGVASAIKTDNKFCVLIRNDGFLMQTALCHFEEKDKTRGYKRNKAYKMAQK
jgi:hypothetical protein